MSNNGNTALPVTADEVASLARVMASVTPRIDRTHDIHMFEDKTLQAALDAQVAKLRPGTQNVLFVIVDTKGAAFEGVAKRKFTVNSETAFSLVTVYPYGGRVGFEFKARHEW